MKERVLPVKVDRREHATYIEFLRILEKYTYYVMGSCGTGKTFLGCALAHKACLFGYTAHYYRMGRLLSELQLNKGDGQYGKRMGELAKTDVLILDDFGLSPLTDEQRRDLLEILDDRHDKRSTIVTSQVPIKLWHETIGNETLADAILDRLIHTSHRLEIKGESMRKTRSKLGKKETGSQEKCGSTK